MKKVTGSVALKGGSRRKISIAIPAYRSQFHAVLVMSMFKSLSALQQRGIPTSLAYIDNADIVVSRNYLLSHFFYRQNDCSHILFLDNDMGFEPSLVIDMLALGKDVVGVIAPKRSIDLEKLHSRSALAFPKAKAQALNFIVSKRKIRETSGKFVKVNGCGAGILLISRKAIERMIEQLPTLVTEERYKGYPAFAGKVPRAITAFDKLTIDNNELSEDFSFCHRWRVQCGGEIWASRDHDIRHVGEYVYSGKHSDLD